MTCDVSPVAMFYIYIYQIAAHNCRSRRLSQLEELRQRLDEASWCCANIFKIINNANAILILIIIIIQATAVRDSVARDHRCLVMIHLHHIYKLTDRPVVLLNAIFRIDRIICTMIFLPFP